MGKGKYGRYPSKYEGSGLGKQSTDWRFLGWLAVLIAGMAVALFLTVGDARGAGAPGYGELFRSGQRCEQVYPAPPHAFEYVGAYGWTRWYTRPVGMEYLRCVRRMAS